MSELVNKPVTSVNTSKPSDILTKKQKLFIEAYAGDEVVAMQIAGYSGEPGYLRQQAKKLLSQPKILKALQDRTRYLINLGSAKADREERMMMWSSIMNNHDPHAKQEYDANGIPIQQGNIPLSVRLKASELLGKAEGDFVTQIDINHNVTVSDIIQQSYHIEDKPLEVIEAEYMELREKKKSKNEDESNDAPSTLEDLI
jgi:hypothetical protein